MTERRLLEAGELAEQGPPEAVRLPIDLVDPSPDNPRRALVEIPELAASIREFGLLQAIAVRRMGDRYQLVAGHRRRAAFLFLAEQELFEPAWRSIPAIVKTEADDERARLMLISAQVHNRNWTPKEEAGILEDLAATRTLGEVGRIIHKSEPWLSRRLKLYADAVLSGFVQAERLAPTVATELLAIKDAGLRREFAERAIAQDWTQTHARAEVRKLQISAQLRELGRRVQDMLTLLASVQADQIDVVTFRDLQVLRGRIEALGEAARAGTGPVYPTLVQAPAPRKLRPRRRTMPRPS